MKCRQVLSPLLVVFSLSGCGGDDEEVHLGTRFQAVGWQTAYTLTGRHGVDTYLVASETWNAQADEHPCCPGWGPGEVIQALHFVRAGSALRMDGTPYEDGDVGCRLRSSQRYSAVDGFSMEERVLVEPCIIDDGCLQRPCGPDPIQILLQSRNPGSDATGTVVDFWVQQDDPAEDPPNPRADCYGNNYPRSFCHREDIPPGDSLCPLVGPTGEPPPPHWCSLCQDDDPETNCEPLSDP